jgi:hypothetical protein
MLSPCVADQAGGPAQTIHVRPTPRPTPRPILVPVLPAPSGLHYTTDPENCVHNGGSVSQCERLTDGKAIALYWSWRCNGKGCAIGGYHLRLAGVGHSGSSDRKIVESSTGRFLVKSEPAGGWRGACYVVTAYPASAHAAAQSEPSPKTCIRATYKVVTVKADTARGYAKEYSILYSDNQQQVQTYPPRTGSDQVVGGTFDSTNQSQANTFQRAAYAFDLSSIGGKNLFGGTFAYDRGPSDPRNSCAELHRAPNGWKSATWIIPPGGPLPGKFTKSGSTLSWPIDGLLKKWNRSTPFALSLEEVYGVGPAEFIQSGVVPYSFTCQSVIIKPRLILKVGVTV